MFGSRRERRNATSLNVSHSQQLSIIRAWTVTAKAARLPLSRHNLCLEGKTENEWVSVSERRVSVHSFLFWLRNLQRKSVELALIIVFRSTFLLSAQKRNDSEETCELAGTRIFPNSSILEKADLMKSRRGSGFVSPWKSSESPGAPNAVKYDAKLDLLFSTTFSIPSRLGGVSLARVMMMWRNRSKSPVQQRLEGRITEGELSSRERIERPYGEEGHFLPGFGGGGKGADTE